MGRALAGGVVCRHYTHATSWPEAYGEFDAIETPAEADILADFDAWWERCVAWEPEEDEPAPDPALELIEVRRELSELREVVDIMLTGGDTA